MKRKMKAVAALSLAAVMLLAGCGSSKGTQDGGSTTAADTAEQQEGTETAASDSGEKIVIRVVGPMENENDTTNPVTKQTVRGYYVIKELYEAEHPNVELQLTGIPWDSWQAKLTTVAAANQVDVVVHGASIVDIVEDLTPYAEKDGDFLDGLLLKYSYRRADNWFLPVSRSQQQQHLLCMIRRSLMIMDLTILMKHGLGKMCLMRQRK